MMMKTRKQGKISSFTPIKSFWRGYVTENYNQINVDIVGHTDQVGSDKYNDKISLQRAESVKKYLIAKGVDASRIITIGKGKRDLLFKGKDPTSRFYNRRIEFKVK